MGQTEVNPADLQKAKEAFDLFDTFLDSSEYAAVDTFSVADIALLVTVSAFEACGFDLSPYKRVQLWFGKAKEACAGYEEIVGKTMVLFKEKLLEKTSQN